MQRKHGEKLVMDWNKVVGSRGRAHFKPRTYTNGYGEEKTINDLDRFIDYNPEFFSAKKPEVAKEEDVDLGDDLPF